MGSPDAYHQLAPVNAHVSRKALMLKRDTIVDATIISAPSSTKNARGERDSEMHQTKKGDQLFFGMRAHVGADADSALAHKVSTTATNASHLSVAEFLLDHKEEAAHADAGYIGADKQSRRKHLRWAIAAKRALVKF